MAQNKLIRIGIVGAGGVVEGLHMPVLASLEHVHVAWVCDKDLERAQRVARAFGVEKSHERIDDCGEVDAALVAIPVGYRAAVLATCFRRGWDVFCEKPFASSLRQFDGWVEAADRARVRLGVGLMRRFYAPTRTAVALIAGRVFGDILEVYAGEGGHMRATNQPGSWYQSDRQAAGGGVLIETGSHLIDQTLRIVGADSVSVKSVTAEAENYVEHDIRVHADVKSAHQEAIPVRFFISRSHDVTNGIFVRCKHATVTLGTTPDATVSISPPDGGDILARVDSHSAGAAQSIQAFRMEWEAFLGPCLQGRNSDVDVPSARLSMQLTDDCYRALWPALYEGVGG